MALHSRRSSRTAGARAPQGPRFTGGAWVATSFTLGEEQAEHMGIMRRRVVDGTIQESYVVARDVWASDSDLSERKLRTDQPKHRQEGPRLGSLLMHPTTWKDGVLGSLQVPLGGGGDVFPEHLLVPDTDRGVQMDELPLAVPLKEDTGIAEGYLRAIG